MEKHRIINSKMKKMTPLLQDPILSRHVPETYWFDEERLKSMFFAHSSIYIKPDRGRRGIGISRMKRLEDSMCELSYEDTVLKLHYPKAAEALKSRMEPWKEYIVQEGINLSTYQGRPFHIRSIMQKPLGRWQLSLVSAILAKKKNAVVTNVSRGNYEIPVGDALHQNDQLWDPMRTQREIINLSYQFAQVIGAKLPLMVMGLDLAIDKKGKIWFIEANSRPNIAGTDKVCDKSSLQKYFEAKKWIQ